MIFFPSAICNINCNIALGKSFVAMRMGNAAPSECWMHKSWINAKYLLMTLPRYRYRCIRISDCISICICLSPFPFPFPSVSLSLFSLCNLANIVENMRIQFHSQFRWLARRSPRLSNFERYRPSSPARLSVAPLPTSSQPTPTSHSFGKFFEIFWRAPIEIKEDFSPMRHPKHKMAK